MSYERLTLEVGARLSGLVVAKPAVIRGTSGVEHKFTFVAVDGSLTYAFDFFTEVREVDVIRTYIKKFDTGAKVFVVCPSGKVRPEARSLSASYGIEILGQTDIEDFFAKSASRRKVPARIPTQ